MLLPPGKTPRYFALLIGLDRVDEDAYLTSPAPLASPSKNVNAFAEMFTQFCGERANLTILKNKAASRANIFAHLQQLTEDAEEGDCIFITFSGHGGQVKDFDNKEEDGFDETWGCYDGEIIDDQLCHYWSKFKAGIRVVVLSDSCHSGTILKSKNSTKPSGESSDLLTCESGAKVQASVLSISSVKDQQYGQDGQSLSPFTKAVCRIWQERNPNETFESFHKRLLQEPNTSYSREPQLQVLGPSDRQDDLKAQFFNN